MKNLLYIVITFLLAGVFFLVMTVPWQPSDSIKVYFLKNGGIATVNRNAKKGVSMEKSAIKELLKGPSFRERQDGFFTEIPRAAKLVGISREGDLIRVNFSAELEKYGGGTSTVKGLLAQIIYTLTEIKGIEKVRILINGKEEVSLGGEGYIIDKPLSRIDLETN